jgi:beta-lactamase regulating signal transducer with metallopeptidase domain
MRFLLLPILAVLSIGAAFGPTLWRILYPPVRQFCLTQLERLDMSYAAWYVLVSLGSIGLGVALFILAKETARMVRLRRAIACHRTELPAALRQLRKCRQLHLPIVYVEDSVVYAFCYGLFHPAIVISSGLYRSLSEAEVEAVLLHEAAHARAGDPLKILLSRLVTGALFYLPAIHRFHARYILRLEIMADRAVVKALDVKPLAAALSKILQGSASVKATGIAANIANSIDERIRYLLEPHRKLPPLIVSRPDAIATSMALASSALIGGGFVGLVNSLVGSGALCNVQM